MSKLNFDLPPFKSSLVNIVLEPECGVNLLKI